MFHLSKVELTTDLPLNKNEVFWGLGDKNFTWRRNSFGIQLFLRTKFCFFVVPESHFHQFADYSCPTLRCNLKTWIFSQTSRIFVCFNAIHALVLWLFIWCHLETKIYDFSIPCKYMFTVTNTSYVIIKVI